MTAAGPEVSASSAPLPLYVAVNSGCNLKCWYCTEHGENRGAERLRLSLPRLRQILETAYGAGFRTFRFTGGEPTLRKDIAEILLAAQDLGDDVRIAMTTNGVRLGQLADCLARLREPRVFVSVDGIADQRTGLPPAGTGDREFQIEKWLTPELVDAIETVRGAARVRLNFVLTRGSADQLDPLLDFAAGAGLDVKIFELLLRDFFYAGQRPRMEVFREQYVPIRELLPDLRGRYGPSRPFAGLGGKGIPMRCFDTGSSKVVYFDSLQGSHYGETCKACPHMPCQEGLYSLVLDSRGTLHPAGCVNTALHRRLAIAKPGEVEAAFAELTGEIQASSFLPVVPAALADYRALEV